MNYKRVYSCESTRTGWWVTGGDAPTDKQKGFIATLAQSTGEDVDPDSLTKGEASLKIDELKKKQDEGAQSNDGPRVSSRIVLGRLDTNSLSVLILAQSTTTGSDKLPSELPADETSPPSDSHLAHPETWTTGKSYIHPATILVSQCTDLFPFSSCALSPGHDPATDKQKGFIHVLARQHDVKDPVPEQMSKSEASEMIEKLKKA